MAQHVLQRGLVGAVPADLALVRAGSDAVGKADVMLDQVKQHARDRAAALEQLEHQPDHRLDLLVRKLVVLVLDQAGWHVSDRLVVPDGIVLEFLPSYTPELQPAERLWPLTNEAVANRHFATLKDLDTALSMRCRTLATMPEIIKAETRFGWWPAAALAN
jgi:hypothetical protein